MTTTIETDDAAFLRAIAAAPGDAAPRLVYADFLQERGDDAGATAQRQLAGVVESWRLTWRNGFAHTLPVAGLKALRDALIADDVRLVQGSTTTPPPLMCVQDWPVEAADALGYCGWKGEGLATVGEVEEFFARVCFECNQRLGEAAACRWWLSFWDDTPRYELFALMLPEVELAIAARTICEVVARNLGPVP